MIQYIFTTSSGLMGLAYIGPSKKNKNQNVFLQLYKESGEFINEYELLKADAEIHTELFFYYQKDKQLFSIMDTKTTADFDQQYTIYQYRIEE